MLIRDSLIRLLAVAVLGVLVAGCVDENGKLPGGRGWVAISSETQALMNEKGMTRADPILIRAYKKESELEVWKKGRDGTYQLLKTYPMCRWSGQLGPKTREGDRQVPEGFYAITPGQMNPNSNYYLSFNVGYPNQLDRAYGRTGALIMVHGACSSAGCFSMTDEQIGDLYAVMREAFTGGQKSVQFESFPFRMTAKNLAKFRLDPNMPFWKNLKEGSDHFDVSKAEPQVAVCNRHYVFDAKSKGGSFEANTACPPMETSPELSKAVAEKQHTDEVKVAELVQSGEKAVRVVYQDGDQHESFKAKHMEYSGGVPVSQIDALAQGPTEIPIEEGASPAKAAVVKVASSTPAAPRTAPAAIAAPATPVQAQAFAPMEAPAATPVEAAVAAKSAPGFFSLNRLSGGLLGGAKDETTDADAGPAQAVPVDVPLPPSRQAAALAGKQAAAVPTQYVGTAQ